jgi:hypothetical protein
MFENRVLRTMLDLRGMKWQEAGEKLHNEELDSFYSSAHIISTIKSRRMRWVVHVISIMVIRNIQ